MGQPLWTRHADGYSDRATVAFSRCVAERFNFAIAPASNKSEARASIRQVFGT